MIHCRALRLIDTAAHLLGLFCMFTFIPIAHSVARLQPVWGLVHSSDLRQNDSVSNTQGARALNIDGSNMLHKLCRQIVSNPQDMLAGN